ncbi:molybdopterin-dependent oxidoreductase [candidate division KSB1 bacterium]|nr:molybdopterin-dependent oxidoreductase [candidate division KSB1 bacterium]NIR69556.1 molybdopterin-dependent oxidoreductase [candidate division KSB1 bacterium]NIS25904.1 molybdopterin-dependent oxidoreductase [candidate division KSB1 bacterium]NIT72785.1 molybdopterin-dependent oxidoreductase [candidate division KSB1 bacterium]NIU26592.1 molybdopterin-dependent oxidoreductase [candidate division KSB1 bacterium]
MSNANLIEKIAEKLHLIPNLDDDLGAEVERLSEPGSLNDYPPQDRWDDWVEYEAKSWPRRDPRHYMIVPTTCFNCEAGCGLLSYIDKETLRVRKFEGNPYHPGSRGRNCAKGPATINQINDTDRILYPLRRAGKRGEGKWQRVSWDEVLDDIAGRIRTTLEEKRNNDIVYHVGRPGHEGYVERVLQSWGVDGHNSHTNICSSGARFGYSIWHFFDRPSPDHANAKFILLISAHLESGHYFNPHAQRIIEGLMNGAKLAVLDPRLSNTASMADYWMPSYPGSEAAILLATANVMLEENLYNEDFLRNWVNWQTYLEKEKPQLKVSFENFVGALKGEYKEFTPEFAEQESGVPAKIIRQAAIEIGKAGTQFATHNWRSAGSGNLGGWAVARSLHFLNVLTGSVGTVGGTSPSGWNKFKPNVFDKPPAQKFWNELHWPKEYPLAHYELSFLLPHFLKDNRGKLSVYFTRVFNPVWTYPDGFTWIEALQDETKIGLHAALTPTWNETAYFADYVLPMGHASERHDILSYETHSGMWLAFRQPVLREAARKMAKPVRFTYEANPGEVWEEDEFWIELSWRIDPDGNLGIKEHFMSPYRQGEKITIDEYYQYIFEHVPGLTEKAGTENLTPLNYMRKYGAFEVEETSYNKHLKELSKEELKGTKVDKKNGLITRKGKPVGVMVDGVARAGFPTPSRRQEFYSQTLMDWGWPEYKIPVYIKSHIHPETIDREEGEFPLVPTFRLPTLIHSRSGNAKWLTEISNRNPLWMHPGDARRLEIATGDLVRVNTDIGYFVTRLWTTEGMKPGVVACSHHLGRWRRHQDPAGNRWATNLVSIEKTEEGRWKMHQVEGIRPYKSDDRDSVRIFWSDGGVHQNITFAVHPDPVSGMHCWHQKVRIEKAHPEDKYGDIFVDTNKSFEIYKEWLKMTRPAPGPEGLRRPLWLNRPLRPVEEMFYVKS